MGTPASEGGDRDVLPAGQTELTFFSFVNVINLTQFLIQDFCAGDAAFEQLREEKEFAEGQVTL